MKTKLRVGIIGAGSVVREIYQYLYFRSCYSPILDIQGVADPNDECRNWFGDLAKLPANRRFKDYKDLLNLELDAVQVNTPDHFHCRPAIDALQHGLDVVVPKPTAATLNDTHSIIEAAKKNGRFLGVDFHKREDPRLKEAEARFQSGRYGAFQAAVFYMLDKLAVADPNHSPRFFATADFAEKNTPVSFLTVHMADALLQIVKLIPVQVRAIGYAQKLPSLRPIPVRGYDLVDTEILFDNGAVAHILTGWALPNTAWSTTVQSARLICSEGLIDLNLDMPGLREVHSSALTEVNPLFRNFEVDNTVTGYGISSPGKLYEKILQHRSGQLSQEALDSSMNPMALGLYTTLVLEGAERSLAQGAKPNKGVTIGDVLDLRQLASEQLSSTAVKEYGLGGNSNM